MCSCSQLVLIEAPNHVTKARPPRLLKKKDSDGMDSGEAGELSFGAPLGFAPLSLLPDLSVFNSIFIA